MRFLIFILLLAGTVLPAEARGRIYVIDGDSIRLGKREIRLQGIDAPEYHQECYDEKGKPYGCGIKSRHYLQKLAGDDLHCDTKNVDRYGREVAVCYSKGLNLNQKMVEDGQAAAYDRYTTDYAAAEKTARENKRGIWRGRFMKPELYRILQKD